MGVNSSLVGVTKFESDPSLAGAKGNALAKPGTFVGLTPKGEHQIRGQAFGGYIHAKSEHTLVHEVVVNDVPFTAIEDIIKVFDDEGIISAILWRDY